jgi:transglutaminase-like putative cysteine protease
MEEYLQTSEVIDWNHPAILALAQTIASGHRTTEAIAKACFEWVRDEIRHSYDYQMNPITCRASDVLQHKTGYCYAKSHLLAALLRANDIPAGFCYQRLSINDRGAPYSLHGFNAVYLPEVGWYRIDARGNREGVDAQFTPPRERLAFKIQVRTYAWIPYLVGAIHESPLQLAVQSEICVSHEVSEEADFPAILSKPLQVVVEALQAQSTWDEMLHNLPDVSLESAKSYGLVAEEY